MFKGVFGASILKKAQEKGAVALAVSDIRDYSENKHKQVMIIHMVGAQEWC